MIKAIKIWQKAHRTKQEESKIYVYRMVIVYVTKNSFNICNVKDNTNSIWMQILRITNYIQEEPNAENRNQEKYWINMPLQEFRRTIKKIKNTERKNMIYLWTNNVFIGQTFTQSRL